MNHVSQQQIAQALGYSQSLVSKVLNNRGAKVPTETARKIWEFARSLDYRPRGIDLNLLVADSISTHMVGFVLRAPLRLTSGSPIFIHAHEGMHNYLRRKNILSVFLGTEGEVDADVLTATLQRQKMLLGIVLMGQMQPGFVRQLATAGKPIVFVSGQLTGLAHSVHSNLPQAGEQLVEHLHQLGHRRFAWVGSSHSPTSNTRHRTAFSTALEARGLHLPDACVYTGQEANRAEGHLAARELLAQNRRNPPTAIVCSNGLLARGVVNSLFQLGRRVPDDISVATFDTTHVCMEETPSITGATAPADQLGARAAELIVTRAQSEDRSLSEIGLSTSLTVRESTGPVRRSRRPA